MATPNMPTSQSQNLCTYYPWQGGMKIAARIKAASQLISRSGDYLGGPNITEGLEVKEGSRRTRSNAVQRKTQPAVVGFEDSRRLRAKECRQPPAAGGVKETGFPLEPAAGAQPS